MPKKQKHRKSHKGRSRGQGEATTKTDLAFGIYGIKATSHGWITSRQIESARRGISRFVKRGGKLWIRIFPDKPITKKGAEVPMGSGKGSPEGYVAIVKPGTIMFEIDGVSEEVAREAVRIAGHKLPTTTKFISR